MSDQDWDDPQRQVVGSLRQRHPGWMIVYGRYSRMYWAFPKFTVFPGNYFGATDPSELDQRMLTAEQDLGGP